MNSVVNIELELYDSMLQVVLAADRLLSFCDNEMEGQAAYQHAKFDLDQAITKYSAAREPRSAS
jgi:hypothetical protein